MTAQIQRSKSEPARDETAWERRSHSFILRRSPARIRSRPAALAQRGQPVLRTVQEDESEEDRDHTADDDENQKFQGVDSGAGNQPAQ